MQSLLQGGGASKQAARLAGARRSRLATPCARRLREERSRGARARCCVRARGVSTRARASTLSPAGSALPTTMGKVVCADGAALDAPLRVKVRSRAREPASRAQVTRACKRAQVASWLARQVVVTARARVPGAHARESASARACSARAQERKRAAHARKSAGAQRTRAGRLASAGLFLLVLAVANGALQPGLAERDGASPSPPAGPGRCTARFLSQSASALQLQQSGVLGARAACARDPLPRPKVVVAAVAVHAHTLYASYVRHQGPVRSESKAARPNRV